jgi:tetratricopeptide (TPR) repeat protein
MNVQRLRHLAWITSVVVLATGLAGSGARAGQDAGTLRGKTQLGVALAMSGEAARAESVFVSLLSDSRGDARALNNLGNLRLLGGELGVALAFYDRALNGDSADAGIHLNRATALMLMGDEERARQAAAVGVRLAGGLDKADALLGLTSGSGSVPKGAAGAYISKDEVRELLRRAARAVPSDTVYAAPPAAASAHRKAPTWRSAGPRGADRSGAADVLYWKR